MDENPELNLELIIHTNIYEEDIESKRADLVIKSKQVEERPVLIDVAASSTAKVAYEKLSYASLTSINGVKEIFVYDYQTKVWTTNNRRQSSYSSVLSKNLAEFISE